MKYSKDVREFIEKNVEGMTTKDLAVLVNETFGTDFTANKMKCYKQNHKLKSGTITGVKKGQPTDLFPEEIRKYIKENYRGCGPKEMTERLNNLFGTSYTKQQIKGFYGNNDLNSGLTGKFEKGSIPPNKGKKGYCHPASVPTQFKKGSEPANKREIGTVVKKTDGYYWKKTGPGARDWKQLHRLMWEEENGPVPKGCVLTFKNGNKEDVRIENLAVVTLGENAVLNKKKLRFENAEASEAGLLIAKITMAARKKQTALAAE